MIKISILTLMLLSLFCGNIFAETTKKISAKNKDEKSVKKPQQVIVQDNFPWNNFIANGKVSGCIYKNKFYSEGAILINGQVPRKCVVQANLDAAWSSLEYDELEMYKKYNEPPKKSE